MPDSESFTSLEKKIFEVAPENFDTTALEVFRFQYAHNPLYQAYCLALRKHPEKISFIEDIPFLPISFFKSHSIKTTEFEPDAIFESSGTTGPSTSRHHIRSLKLYQKSFFNTFNHFYPNPESICILGLLPSYLERGNSSLVYMTQHLINQSQHPNSGFFLHEEEKLFHILQQNESTGTPTLLLGVTYALLDFSESYSPHLRHTIVMETGGMKGRKKEMLRKEVHDLLKKRFHIDRVHSEYGMTELMSQAYACKDGIYHSPAWMKALIRSEDNPLDICEAKNISTQLSGAVNIIDLANLYSCAFIATDDAGTLHSDGSFEVTGRMDNSDLRGCSLLTIQPSV